MAASVRRGNNCVGDDRGVEKLQKLRLMREGFALDSNNRRTESNMVLAEGVARGADVRQNYDGFIQRQSRSDDYSKWSNKSKFGEDPPIRRQRDHDKYRVRAEIPSFSGKFLEIEDFIDWVSEVEKFFELMEIPPHKMVKLVTYELKDCAAVWWNELQWKRARQEKIPIQSWRRMKKLLMDRFLPLDYEQHLFLLYSRCSQGNKSIRKYTTEFMRLADLNYLQESEYKQISRYLKGLNVSIRDRMRLYTFYTLDEAHKLAQIAEYLESTDNNMGDSRRIQSCGVKQSMEECRNMQCTTPTTKSQFKQNFVEDVGVGFDETEEEFVDEEVKINVGEVREDIDESKENVDEIEESVNKVEEDVAEFKDCVKEKSEEEPGCAKFVQKVEDEYEENEQISIISDPLVEIADKEKLTDMVCVKNEVRDVEVEVKQELEKIPREGALERDKTYVICLPANVDLLETFDMSNLFKYKEDIISYYDSSSRSSSFEEEEYDAERQIGFGLQHSYLIRRRVVNWHRWKYKRKLRKIRVLFERRL